VPSTSAKRKLIREDTYNGLLRDLSLAP
jgi:hypothetical protein